MREGGGRNAIISSQTVMRYSATSIGRSLSLPFLPSSTVFLSVFFLLLVPILQRVFGTVRVAYRSKSALEISPNFRTVSFVAAACDHRDRSSKSFELFRNEGKSFKSCNVTLRNTKQIYTNVYKGWYERETRLSSNGCPPQSGRSVLKKWGRNFG